ncbi:metalloregulator ArsR/SmtB family transcription factor [Cohnella suwonensis]|uniref:Metalloregulator ArsR/SmtB family transcription factor n=1 Tax=Cohnella suwonensis TaxID=696072 RepID=A0ABW0M282_9BACL
MNGRAFKDALYPQFARIGKCLSSDKRLELLNLLSQGPKSVEKLAQGTEMTIANVSRHLQIMSDARLVKHRKKGTFVFYELADSSVADFLLSLWKLCERQLADVQKIKEDFLDRFEDTHTLTLEEFVEKRDRGEIVLLDVRPVEEYEAEHIPGAISFPIDDLESELNQLNKDVEIVAYCRGPYCVYSAQAVSRLRSEGYSAYRIEEGVHEWRQYSQNVH